MGLTPPCLFLVPVGQRLGEDPRRFHCLLHLGQVLGLLELVRLGGLGGEMGHLVPAGLVGPATVGVGAVEDAGLLAAEGAGAGG